MRLTPGEVLYKLADHEREHAEQKISALTQQRLQLSRKEEALNIAMTQLHQQYSEQLNQGATAAALHELDAEKHFLRQQGKEIKTAIEALREQEQVLLREWLTHEQKRKAFGKLNDAADRKQERIQEKRQQQQLDDMTATRFIGMRQP
ncbi:MAG: flagellar FliJ family protein [Mariprofundaceae bacterium]